MSVALLPVAQGAWLLTPISTITPFLEFVTPPPPFSFLLPLYGIGVPLFRMPLCFCWCYADYEGQFKCWVFGTELGFPVPLLFDIFMFKTNHLLCSLNGIEWQELLYMAPPYWRIALMAGIALLNLLVLQCSAWIPTTVADYLLHAISLFSHLLLS